ncbi:hypothetical protein DFH06DRAFT_1330008 [Mycena polygramma]|nr:hypothetical protein DFH06DRAFT_1330008 [Mycena polygramma]
MPHDAAERDEAFSCLYTRPTPKYDVSTVPHREAYKLAENLPPGDWDDEWLEDQQSDFILRLFLNIRSLPLIFVRRISDDGVPFTYCVDGQQYLLALRRFMDGSVCVPFPALQMPEALVLRISSSRSDGVETWYKAAAPGADKPLLSDATRNRFDKMCMICMTAYELKPSEEEEVVNTPRSDFVRMLCDHFLDPVMQDVLPWQDRKATDYTSPSVCVSQIVKTVDSGEANLDICELRAWLCQGDPILPITVESVKHTFSTFRLLVVDPQHNDVFHKSPPFTYVEFIGVALLISALKESESLRYIVDRISEMRKDVMNHDELSRVNFDAIVQFIAEV